MTAIPATSSIATDRPRASSERLSARLLRSGRVLIGGGILGLVILLCLVSLPWTLNDASPLHFDGQRPAINLAPPDLMQTGTRKTTLEELFEKYLAYKLKDK